jgi:hypothetical protein
VRIKFSAIIFSLALVGFTVAGVSAQPKYGVTVGVANTARLEKATTYAWIAGTPSADKTIDQQIVAAVDHELAARGFTKVAVADANVLATYRSTSRTDVELKGKAAANGTRPQYQVGTLTVDLVDPASREKVFSVRTDSPITAGRAELEADINAAVAAMFQKYPVHTAPKK